MSQLFIYCLPLQLSLTYFIFECLLAQLAAHQVTSHITPDVLRAPESILQGPWDSKVDMWTYGCLVRPTRSHISHLYMSLIFRSPDGTGLRVSARHSALFAQARDDGPRHIPSSSDNQVHRRRVSTLTVKIIQAWVAVFR